ncbi:MAG: DUF885 domain-containing protein [Armatimonadota bacterium]|nr:DUF885 domain-containing protein [Armatimonadota bacterium]
MTDTTERFRRLVEDFLSTSFSFYPSRAARMGIHTYDGQVGDYRPESVAEYLRRLRGICREVEAIPPGELPPLERYEADLIRWRTRREEFYWEEFREQERNPIAFIDLLDVSGYLKRAYAPVEERLVALARHLREVPRVLEMARHLLRLPLSYPVVETSIEAYSGYHRFLTELPAMLPPAPERLKDEIREACAGALDALKEFLAFLEGERGRATGQFAIGEELFSRMLEAEELVNTPLEELLAKGEELLQRNLELVREAAARISPGKDPREVMASLAKNHPPRERLLEEARETLDRLRQFLLDHPIVTLPTEDLPIVAETPPYDRWAFAMMDTVGPFEERATESYYYITLPEESWPPEVQEAWLTKFDRSTLQAVSIHEVYPGHFLHLIFLRKVPSPIAKAFHSYAFVEGWAHYCEEMLLEQGYGSGDLPLRLGQLSEALLRNVRYLVAIRMHTRGMTIEEATRAFIEYAYMEELPARKEAFRGSFDPMYLNYLLGKLLILELREDYARVQGEEFSLRAFHDRLLSLGAPPLPLARKQLLPEGTSEGRG